MAFLSPSRSRDLKYAVCGSDCHHSELQLRAQSFMHLSSSPSKPSDLVAMSMSDDSQFNCSQI